MYRSAFVYIKKYYSKYSRFILDRTKELFCILYAKRIYFNGKSLLKRRSVNLNYL